MGGLRKYMPITFWCYLIGMLALSGVPPFAGFFSKDEILLATFHRNKYAWGLATFAAFLTAFYMTRQMFMVFCRANGAVGEVMHSTRASARQARRHGHGHHEPHEVSWNMWLPIAVLSVFAIGLWVSSARSGSAATCFSITSRRRRRCRGRQGRRHGRSRSPWGLLGIVLGWVVYGRKTDGACDAIKIRLRRRWVALFTFLNRKWYIDELYDATIIRFTATCGMFFRLVDKLVVDGFLHAIAWMAWAISQVFRWIGDEFFINGGFDAGCESVRRAASGWRSCKAVACKTIFAC